MTMMRDDQRQRSRLGEVREVPAWVTRDVPTSATTCPEDASRTIRSATGDGP